jgi:hypothetical protein
MRRRAKKIERKGWGLRRGRKEEGRKVKEVIRRRRKLGRDVRDKEIRGMTEKEYEKGEARKERKERRRGRENK